jgi:hypothetical protein
MLDLALESIGGGEPRMNVRNCRIGAARLFQADDRFVGARLQQMHPPAEKRRIEHNAAPACRIPSF